MMKTITLILLIFSSISCSSMEFRTIYNLSLKKDDDSQKTLGILLNHHFPYGWNAENSITLKRILHANEKIVSNEPCQAEREYESFESILSRLGNKALTEFVLDRLKQAKDDDSQKELICVQQYYDRANAIDNERFQEIVDSAIENALKAENLRKVVQNKENH